MTEEQKSLQWLSSVLDTLRRECPWDSVQTIDSLRYLTIEETFELSEAIIGHDYDEMRKELGDLFMHLLFYAKIAEDEGRFTTAEVLDGICKKLISRHPHIALPDREGHLQAATADQAPQWEQVKMKERRRSVLEGVPSSLPSLVKAVRMQEKAAGMGFDYANAEQAHDKVREEYGELLEALQTVRQAAEKARETQNQQDAVTRKQAEKHAEEEFGDLLFALVKWGNMQGINADDALARANAKFQRRFADVEQRAASQHRSLQSMSTDELIALWQQAKEQEPKADGHND